MSGKKIAAIGIFLFLGAALGFASTAGSAEDAATYVGAAKCKMCHMAQFRTWEAGQMAKTWERIKDAEDKEKCVACHTTGFGRPGGFTSFEATPHLVGVQCEVCHGPGSLHIAAPREEKKAAINHNQQDCRTCHSPHVADKAVAARAS